MGCDREVEFLVVGAHAVMFHTEPRYTKDIDVWVRPEIDNARRALRGLAAFGAPLSDLRAEDLVKPGTIFQMGVAPSRVDILTSLDALDFATAGARRVPTTYGDIPIAVLSIPDLLANKRSVGRPQDLLDVARLEAAEARAAEVGTKPTRARRPRSRRG